MARTMHQEIVGGRRKQGSLLHGGLGARTGELNRTRCSEVCGHMTLPTPDDLDYLSDHP
jgi:hypothetical protein